MNVTPTSLSPILRSILLPKTVGADICTVSLFVANALYFFWATTVYMALHFAGFDWPQNFFSSIIPGTEMLPELCMMLAIFSGTVCYGLRPPCWQRYLLPVLATIMLSVMAVPFVAAGPRLLLLAFFMALSGGVFALIFHLISLHVAPDITGRFFGFSTAFSLLLQFGFHAAFDASLTSFLTASVLCTGGLAMLLPQCLKQPVSRETQAAEQPAEQAPPRVDISVFRWSVPMTLLIVVLLSLLHGIGDLYMDAYHDFNDLFGFSRLSYCAGSIAAGYFADRNRLYLPLAALFAKAQDILDIWVGQEQVLYYPLHYFGDFMNGFFTLFIILAFVDLAAHRPSLKPWAVTGRSLQMFTVSVATVFGAFILDADKLFFTLLYVLAIVGCLVIVFYSSALRFTLVTSAVDSAAAEVTTSLPAPDYCARYGLTQRETEVLDCILSGQSIAEISEALFISQRTVKFHITKLLRKTGATSQKELLLLLYEKQGK
ncbi:MAG: helix-turn-helix transcriptional regulator [Selenomonas ruminantium]|uniref:Helix-turn-helix transcriptional regulator n=1 Tax=Selenomonas ruminantium TaxID=971 RepID=A0A927ZYR4_SELRU|nr:helix-turn-helix transcriptional regulator [Selenomonas ruminantium]